MPSRPLRPSAASRGYGHAWQKARKGHLAREPLCRPCKKAGLTAAGHTVDHIIPHRGDRTLFWDKTNWQTLCATCSSGDKQRQEKSGVTAYRGVSVDGTPLDPAHHWNDAA